eukprot:6083130-Prymnesium_polylepis.1
MLAKLTGYGCFRDGGRVYRSRPRIAAVAQLAQMRRVRAQRTRPRTCTRPGRPQVARRARGRA